MFEASPLSRVVQQGAPGDIWQPSLSRTSLAGRTAITVYGTNVSEVKLWTVTVNGATSGTYVAGKLYKTTTKDENWIDANLKGGTTDEYKDLEGHIVLKRIWETDTKSLSTYYIYDDLGNLRYVLPPAVNENGQNISSFIDNDLVFKNFIYAYRYDGRKRIIEKKLPGKEWEKMVYNKLDQVVLTQDSLLSKSKQWVYSKYDGFGRVVSSGIYTNTTTLSRAALQSLVDGQTIQWESRSGADYTNVAFPQNGMEPQLVNYYDNYSIQDLPNNQSANYSKKLKTLLTASKVKVLNTANDFLWTVNYYDEEARVVKVYKQHYLGGAVNANNYDEIENTYNFAGELTASNRVHHAGTAVTTIANRYEYDHMGRKLASFEAINGATEVVLNKLDYNEVGQLLKKSVHSTDGSNFTQSNTYAYNSRGWMTKVNDPNTVDAKTIFGMELTYADRTNAFNGNISGMNWKTKVPAGFGLSENTQNYLYDYDNLNRLTKAGYATSGAVDKFNEELSYDVMGNINTLKRTNGSTAYFNNFAYNYTNGTVKGNQLMGITDAGTAAQSSTYQYDENGNQKSDSRKGITIAYNMLNLPKTITKTSTGETLNYTYDATGQKLRKVYGSSIRDYIGGIEYSNNTIEFIQTEEGRAIPGSSYTYEYMIKDHLGNTRAMVKQNGEISQVQDYYAFGLEMNPGNAKVTSPNNLYRYNGKEKQTELSLDQLDYGARFYDPVIGRWNLVDKKSELYFQISPYAYAANTPVNAIDPDGHVVIFINGNFYDGTGGSSRYWRGGTVGTNRFDERTYYPWAFDIGIMNRFNDHNESLKNTGFNPYIDGSLGGHAPHNGNLNVKNRMDAGYEQGSKDAAVLINSLARTNGVITESLKIVTHSMGGAFGKGYIKAIIEYVKAHPKLAIGLSITEYDFAAFQQNKLSAIPGVPLFQFDNKGDDVVAGAVGATNGSHHAKQPGREEKGSNDNVLSYGGHSIGDFMRAISTLSEGNYKFINGKFVKQ